MMNKKGAHLTPEQALDQLEALYEQSVSNLRAAISRYIEDGTLPTNEARANGLFVYPNCR
jgi:AMP nucleosidase